MADLEAAPAHTFASFVSVAVNTGQPSREPFTYGVPAGLDPSPGQAVFVPFGPRVLQGIVLERAESSPIDDVRPIASLADSAPVLDTTHLQLARWVSASYLSPLWDAVAVCLPPGYGQRPVTIVSPVEIPPLLPIYPQDQKILRYIAEHGRVTIDSLKASIGPVSLSRLQRLQRDGHLTVVQGLAPPGARPRYESRTRLLRPASAAAAQAATLEDRVKRSIAARVLRLLVEQPERPTKDLRQTGATTTQLAKLAADGWIDEVRVQVERDPLSGTHFASLPPLQLTLDQQAAVDALEPGRTHLLHGVTGAGKTEVYLELVGRVLKEGRGAIILVPEISLTPQAIRRYGERFGRVLAVRHSHLGTGELHDQWWRIARGEAQVVIGSRSALFAPVRDLGIVVLDEEHEFSYKQVEPAPRYHAREAAAELCRLTGATLVLGSATPDIVTYHRSEVGQIKRLDLTTRVVADAEGNLTEGRFPQVSVVDMRDELRLGNRAVFSRPLHRAIHLALERGEQSILFVNRRGSARFMLCRKCGHIPRCPTCEVSLSLDMDVPVHPRLRCHHCGRQRRLESECPECGSRTYRPFGVGTQRIEQEAITTFPGARVARWDSDVATKKGSHARIVQALERREIDILVGTQMLAKGLDLPFMTVVGVVDADVAMSLPDYHASERAFQLLSQVAGRAGRRDLDGFVYIQTYEPEATPILCAANHDYRSFFEAEIAHRRRAGYPPFSRMAKLVYHHRDQEKALEEASRVATELRTRRDSAGRSEPDIKGPMPAFIPRSRGYYRWQISLRGRDPAALLRPLRLPEGWVVDIDPISLL
ncbi:MAG: primosomal protein N' [Dehalococcoidia bacterium]